jgi:hypothetical protein
MVSPCQRSVSYLYKGRCLGHRGCVCCWQARPSHFGSTRFLPKRCASSWWLRGQILSITFGVSDWSNPVKSPPMNTRLIKEASRVGRVCRVTKHTILQIGARYVRENRIELLFLSHKLRRQNVSILAIAIRVVRTRRRIQFLANPRRIRSAPGPQQPAPPLAAKPITPPSPRVSRTK